MTDQDTETSSASQRSKAERQQDHLRELAAKLDCMTEMEFMLLTNTTAGTVEAWRKRGTGPDYILAGNRFFYSISAVAEFFAANTRKRGPAKNTSI